MNECRMRILAGEPGASDVLVSRADRVGLATGDDACPEAHTRTLKKSTLYVRSRVPS